MTSRKQSSRALRLAVLVCVTCPVGFLLSTGTAQAGERQFLVILAASPKEYNPPCVPDVLDDPCEDLRQYDWVCPFDVRRCVTPCSIDDDCEDVTAFYDLQDTTFVCDPHTNYCVLDLPTTEEIRKQYFAKDDDSIGSLAEYFEEISYGDIRISEYSRVTDWLNLPWAITPPDPELFLTESAGTPVTTESFDTSLAMVVLDTNGDPGGNVDAPFFPEPGSGSGDTVWMPGERFVDMDGDGRWDGLDEKNDMMCHGPNGCTDTLCSESDRPCFQSGDCPRNETCGSDAPGSGPRGCNRPGCGDLRIPCFDWDGNNECTNPSGGAAGCIIPVDDDSILGICLDTSCVPTNCVPDTGDVSLPECCAEEDNTDCLNNGGVDITETNGDPDAEGILCGDPILCCEFDDADGDDEVDIVEPFEDFIVRWNPGGMGPRAVWGRADEDYIRTNYPGDDNKLIGRIGNGYYDSPDSWRDVGSSKMQQEGTTDRQGLRLAGGMTPEPPWYRQMWRDWFGTNPPVWGTGSTPRMIPLDILERRCFDADRGAADGLGTGWIGCSDLDPFIMFATGTECGRGDSDILFSQACDSLILPEERNITDLGERAPLILYDGPREFDDLPSSKYHRSGDGRLGEITSPFSNSIWGEDLGDHNPSTAAPPDGIIPSAGPYATHIHGNLGYDAGNLLHLEMLSWGLGIRDTNVDGLVDQGTRSRAGADYYLAGGAVGRRRLVEDCIEVLDDIINFDEFVDTVALDRVNCGEQPPLASNVPFQYWASDPEVVQPSGICSGIVLLPENIHGHYCRGGFNNGGFCRHGNSDCPGGGACDMGPACDTFHTLIADLFPIHNEDGLNDYPESRFPASDPQFSWNIFFPDLIRGINVPSCSLTIPTDNFQVAYAAHLWLRTWEGFPDLYDYDVFEAGVPENCPTGLWDVMAEGGLVHPAPILKEKPCTDWIRSVDLTTLLTPGVDKVLTLPPAEFVRDESHFFLENDKRAGERLYFWGVGSGFNERMPGPGMLIMHTDFTPECSTDADCPTKFPCVDGFCEGAVSNPGAPPAQQRSGTRPTYLIVQADGEGELEGCSDPDPPGAGDEGDPWPGSTGATEFNFNTNPAARWYTQHRWTGIDISDVVPDGAGSVQLKINWVPTTIPSLRFRQPPGGVSVGSDFQVRFDATDVFGLTTISLFYIEDKKTCSGNGAACTDHSDCPTGQRCRYDTTLGSGRRAELIERRRKTTTGTAELSFNWDISDVPDGRYVLFAKLAPGVGADDEREDKYTTPRPGRNNVGDGSLTVNAVAIDDDGQDDDDKARFETWTAVCIDPQTQKWRVNSTLTQPVLNEANPDGDYPWAETGIRYTSIGGEVEFTITGGLEPFTLDDTFSFTTTGITAVSKAVTIAAAEISENPTAKIVASPLAGDPPLTVAFDGRESVDPNGEPLEYRWDFGDESLPGSGNQVQHLFDNAGKFTVTMTVTNPNNQRFDEADVDIHVTNNSPHAVISAAPTSGQAPLEVQFSAEGSSDTETTDPERLIYFWDFGDGQTANNERVRGTRFESVTHTYRTWIDGTPCSGDSVCFFTATLTVTDECEECEKDGTDITQIVVGNTDPVAVVAVSSLEGPAPLEVRFNAINSRDADGDILKVDWNFGDNQIKLEVPITGDDGMGVVLHTYQEPGDYLPTAEMYDFRQDGITPKGGSTSWSGVTIKVTKNKLPSADFVVRPATGLVGDPFTFDAGRSSDEDGSIIVYEWDFGDNEEIEPETDPTIIHTYTLPNLEGYKVVLTVKDDRGGTDKFTQTVIVEPVPGNRPPYAFITTGARTGTAPVVLTFDGRNSYDPDKEDKALTFTWELRQRVCSGGGKACNADAQCPSGETCGDRKVCKGTGEGCDTDADCPTGGVCDDKIVLLDDLVQWEFKSSGIYRIVLKVNDARGGVGSAGPVDVIISAPGEPPPGQDVSDDGGDDNNGGDSASQRPRGLCGFGMLMSLFASLLGLTAMRVVRQRGRR